jgi:hypothetical protein
MSERVEVRCSAEELAQWKDAAGEVALSRWIRRVLNDATLKEPGRVAYPVNLVPQPSGPNRVIDMQTGEFVGTADELLVRIPERAFRPDPRPMSAKKARPDFKGGKQ